MSEDEVKKIISSLLGENSTDLEVVKKIIKESGGNPFFLYELAQYYHSQLSNLNLTNNSNLVSIEEVLKSRISKLSNKARVLLEVVAISGQPLERNLAKLAAKLTADEQVLAVLRAGRFVRILKYSEKEELDTYHDRKGVSLLKEVLAEVGISWPETSMRALAPLLANRLQIWLRGLDFQQRNESQISSEVLFSVDICKSVAIGLAQVDPLRGSYFNTKHLLLALKAGEPLRIVKAIVFLHLFLNKPENILKSFLKKRKRLHSEPIIPLFPHP